MCESEVARTLNDSTSNDEMEPKRLKKEDPKLSKSLGNRSLFHFRTLNDKVEKPPPPATAGGGAVDFPAAAVVVVGDVVFFGGGGNAKAASSVATARADGPHRSRIVETRPPSSPDSLCEVEEAPPSSSSPPPSKKNIAQSRIRRARTPSS